MDFKRLVSCHEVSHQLFDEGMSFKQRVALGLTLEARGAQSMADASMQGTDAQEDLGEMPEWDLTDLYEGPQSEKLQSDLKTAGKDALIFQSDFQGKIGEIAATQEGGAQLAKAVRRYEELNDTLGRIASYGQLLYSSDNENPVHAKLHGDLMEQITAISSNLLFFGLEFNRLEDGVIDELLKNEELAHYKPWVDDLRYERPYQLSDDLEKLFHDKSVVGRGAWSRLFNETMTALRFEVGDETLALEPTLNLLQSSDGEKRRQAAEAVEVVLGKEKRLFTQITNTLAKDKEIADRWRNFEDVADSRHLSNRVEREVVDALVSAVRSKYDRISHRYYGLKAKWLGVDVMDYWDRNAPLPNDSQRTIPWAEAQETVLSAYHGFAPEMKDIAVKFFDHNWIDAPLRPGKAQGAFSHPTVPSAHPFVLINYQGKPRDVQTLAHELGHGVHQVLAGKQGALMAPTPLTLAETASVFGEMLTFQAQLKKAQNDVERHSLLAAKVEDMINTVVRQIAFYCFERKVHEARRHGELTSEQINEFWLEVQTESLGPAIRLSEGYGTYWSYVPHFIHAPFYVYAYAFGDCLVNSLYAVYADASEGFQEKYFEMLGAGGTKHHTELLAPFGLDASDPTFWDKGLSVIEGMIDELVELDKKL